MVTPYTHTALQGRVTQNGMYKVCPADGSVSPWINSYWELMVGHGEYMYRSVPDNCVDLIFSLDGHGESFIVTPFLTPVEFPISGPAGYFGIRFSALGYQALIKAPLGEWTNPDHYVAAHDVLHSLLIEQIQTVLNQTNDFAVRSEGVSDALLLHLKHPKLDSRLLRFMHSALNPGFDDLGVSLRQLRRISHMYLGVSPKDFIRVARFQAALHQMSASPQWPAWVHFYYDQSHFIREFKNLAGATPGNFLKMSVLYKKS